MANNSNKSPVNKGKRQPRMRLARQPESFHAGNPGTQKHPEKKK